MKVLRLQGFVAGGVLLFSFACSDVSTTLPAASAGTSGSSAGSGTAGAVAVAGAAGTNAQSSAGAGGSSQGGMGGGAGAGAGAGGALAGGAGAGGVGGAAGAAGAAGNGGSGGAADGWVKIFNGQDLNGWVPLIHKSAVNVNIYNTFRADPENQVIKVVYDDYPNKDFDDRCGVLYYDKYLTDYRVRLSYRFREPQALNPVSWGKNNTGLMIFGIDPRKVMGDPEFPPLIEIQLLGTPSGGGTNNANLCQPGGMWVSKLFGQDNGSGGGCRASKSGPAPAAGQWVTIEAEVRVAGETKIYQHPDLTTPVLTISGPMYNNQPVTGGYLAVQSESQPVEYKDIELKELK
jgi:hypothetical protein